MEMVKDTASWTGMVNEHGIYHLARIKADVKTKGLAPPFEAQQAALEKKGQLFIEAGRAKATLEAELARADLDMDNLIRDLYFSKLAQCKNNKRDATFLRWFPEGLSAIIRDGYAGEIGRVTALAAVLEETPDDPLAGKYLPQIKAQLGTYTKTLTAFQASLTVAANAWALLEAEKVNWLAAYRKNYADILSAFGGDKRTADSFFKKAAKAKAKKDNGNGTPAVGAAS